MSLVGPRPERPEYVERFCALVPRYAHRHRVPVGMTGLAAVNGLRGDTSIEDRAQFDNWYIDNWSLWLDLKIMVRTLGSVVTGTGG
jgi:lipopolysaccharide/colanic/teichoic acid biosynthesis glycosyltransferase